MMALDLSEPECHFWHLHGKSGDAYNILAEKWAVTGNPVMLLRMLACIAYCPEAPPTSEDPGTDWWLEWVLADDWRDDHVFGEKGTTR